MDACIQVDDSALFETQLDILSQTEIEYNIDQLKHKTNIISEDEKLQSIYCQGYYTLMTLMYQLKL